MAKKDEKDQKNQNDQPSNQEQLDNTNNTTDQTSVASAEATVPTGEGYGELVPDPGAEPRHLQEQTMEERLDDAKNDALRNHEAEHAGDEQSEAERIGLDAASDNPNQQSEQNQRDLDELDEENQ